MNCSRTYRAIICAALLAPLSARAESTPTFSLQAALEEAKHAPAVQGAQRAVEAKRSLNQHISTLGLNPTITVQSGWRPPEQPPGGWETELSFVQPINLSGFGSARHESAAAELRTLQTAVDSLGLGRQVDTVQAWFTVWQSEQALARATEEAALAATFTEKVERAAALHAVTAAEASEARAYAAEAKLLSINAEGDLFEAGINLARSLGRSVETPVQTHSELPSLPGIPPTVDVKLRASRLPEVALRWHEAQAELAREAEMKAARGWQLQVGGLIVNDSVGGLGGLALVGVTPPISDRGERERATMLAEYERLRGEYETSLAAATADLTAAQHEVEHTQETLETLENQLVPPLRQAVKERERLFDLGEGSVLEALLARRAAISGETRLVRARAAHAAAVWKWKLLLDATDDSHATPAGAHP